MDHRKSLLPLPQTLLACSAAALRLDLGCTNWGQRQRPRPSRTEVQGAGHRHWEFLLLASLSYLLLLKTDSPGVRLLVWLLRNDGAGAALSLSPPSLPFDLRAWGA